MFINNNVQFPSRNNLNILREHVRSFHPESQPPRGHSPFTLLHPTPFTQWHLLLHSAPKVPWLHSAIIKHSNNEKERFVNDNNKYSQFKRTRSVSTLKISKTLDVHANDHQLFYQAHKTICLINININYKLLIHIKRTSLKLIHITHNYLPIFLLISLCYYCYNY